jgi:hypothetical protein
MVGGNRRERLAEGRQHRLGESIANFRPVERKDGDGTDAFAQKLRFGRNGTSGGLG